ncbi:axoneme-associated protein-like [Pyrus ussuriensis x Pyrus communis]|uniref:Axoneme-associated protein-like n=1 Tax=Pyrus ussuriensis x Pyrus communis TaxID=2448454 RepID=A0A5N5H9L1_9ROSA|nr:axoneme-associated protein-like [Pyrus ussuriensis x Pyrus communis]
MDFDEVHSAGSKNEKTSKFGSKKIEKYGTLDLENNYSYMVYLGEEEREDEEEEVLLLIAHMKRRTSCLVKMTILIRMMKIKTLKRQKNLGFFRSQVQLVEKTSTMKVMLR